MGSGNGERRTCSVVGVFFFIKWGRFWIVYLKCMVCRILILMVLR